MKIERNTLIVALAFFLLVLFSASQSLRLHYANAAVERSQNEIEDLRNLLTDDGMICVADCTTSR